MALNFEMPSIVAQPGDNTAPAEAHVENCCLKRNRVLYLNALYSIEMLMVVDPFNVNPVSTFRYGWENRAPWIPPDNRPCTFADQELMRHYMNTYGDFIVHSHIRRFDNVIMKLLKWSDELMNPNEFLMTPLEPNVANSIINELLQCDHNGDAASLPLWSNRPSRKPRGPAHESLSVVERILRGVFETFSQLNRDLHTEVNNHRYGHQKAEILNDKIYLCQQKVKALLEDPITRDVCHIDNDLFPNLNYKSMAHYLSIMFRLFVPKGMHPCGLSKMFNKVLKSHNEDYPAALNYVRRYSSLPPEAVLDIKLPELPERCQVAELLDKKAQVTNLHFGSLVEEYMITQWFADKM